MDIVQWILNWSENIFNAISGFWVGLSWRFSSFFSLISNFFTSVWTVIWYVRSVFQSMWYWLTTLLSWVWDSLKNVIWSWLFWYLYNWFMDLSWIVWYWPALFIASLLFVAMVRICIWLVFKMFRLNVDYKTMVSKWK